MFSCSDFRMQVAVPIFLSFAADISDILAGDNAGWAGSDAPENEDAV